MRTLTLVPELPLTAPSVQTIGIGKGVEIDAFAKTTPSFNSTFVANCTQPHSFSSVETMYVVFFKTYVAFFNKATATKKS